MNKSYDAIIIGAGHNGLTTAALLAQKGKKVLVVERRSITGGIAAAEEFHPGYKSPGLLHDTSGVRRSVIKQLQLENHGLSLYNETPPVFVPQLPGSGSGLLLHTDPQQAAGEIQAFSKEDAQQYPEFRAFIKTIGGVLRGFIEDVPPVFMDMDAIEIWPLFKKGHALRKLGKKNMMETMRILPMCAADWLDEWFETGVLKAALAGPAIYGTFTGPRSPAGNSFLLWQACMEQTPVRGGAQALAQALEKSARALGVDIQTDAEVSRILTKNNSVTGVKLAGGDELSANIVAASCSPKHTFLELLSSRDISQKLATRMEHFRVRGTTAKVHLALSNAPAFACRPDHPVEFARTGEDLVQLEKAFDASKYRRFSDHPILDIYVPTVSTPGLAPDGHAVMSILVHFAPYCLEGGWNDEQREKLGDTVVSVLESYMPGLPGSIVAREVLSPMDLESRYGLTGGHIYHGEPGLDQLLVRPVPECERYATPINGLFLCGSGSHPGGGLTCGPGALAAQVIA